MAPLQLSAHASLPDTHFLAAVCHISFYRGHIHDEITHQALGPVFIMYEWVYPLGVWRPGWGKQKTRERLRVCQRLTKGWVGLGERLCGRGLVQAWFMCSVGSQSDVLYLSLALLQTSLPRRSAVPSAKHSREGTYLLNSTPVLSTEYGPTAHLWIMFRPNLTITCSSSLNSSVFIVALQFYFR